MLNGQIRAIIWDYDGTLVDTRRKNLLVTRKIVEQVTGKDAREFLALQSLESYMIATKKSTNWRELYQAEFGMTDPQTDQAGWLWTEYQIQDSTPVPFYDGLGEVLATLRQLPQGIVSQNARQNIANTLQVYGLSEYFGCIIGFEEVDLQRQKPEPDGLLQCVAQLTGWTSGQVVYIGDHETDVRCARNANVELRKQQVDLRIISIGVSYGFETNPARWNFPPDYTATTPQEILHLVECLQSPNTSA